MPTEFPSYLKIEHRPNAAAKNSFLAELAGALDDGKRKFREFSDEAQRQLDSALSIKRNQFGSLDLGVDQLKSAASAQQARAVAAREVAQATALAAREQQDYSQQTRLAIAATEALAIEEERAAAKALSHAQAAEQVQVVLNRQKSATDAVVLASRQGTTANHLLVNSQRSLRIAGIQTGQQLQDIAISLYSGQRATVVFAQQLPQLAFALTYLEGNANKAYDRIGKLASTLSGPWGLAVGLAAGAAVTLIARLLDIGGAADEAKRKSKDLEGELDFQRQTTKELTAAIEDQLKAAEKSIRSAESQARAAQTVAEKNIDAAKAIREQTLALLESAQIASKYNLTPEGQAGAAAVASNLEDDLKLQRENLDKLERIARIRRAATADFGVDASLDPIKAREREAERAVEREKKAYEGLTGAYKDASDALKLYQKRTTEIKQARDKDIAALREQQRLERREGRPGVSETAAFGSPLSRSYPVTGRFNEQRPGHKHAGVDYAAPLGTSVLAPQVGVVESVGFSPTLGKYVVLAHGGGTTTRFGHLSDNSLVAKGQEVAQGDVIGRVGSTGRSTGPHLHYEVRVNGKAVDPTKGQYPIDPVKVADAADKAGAKLQDFGNRASESIARITEQFDKQPRAIDQAERATRALDTIYDQLKDKKLLDPDFVDQIERARAAIADFSTRPFQDMVKDSREAAEVQRLVVSGRQVEAEVLARALDLTERQGSVTDQQLITIRQLVLEQRKLTAEEEKQNDLRQRNVRLIEDTYGNIRQALYDIARGGSFGSVGSAFKRQFDLVLQKMIDDLTTNLFGDFFRDQKDKALGFDKVKEASLDQVKVIDRVKEALDRLGKAADVTAASLAGGSVPGIPASGSGPTFEQVFDKVFAHRLPANDNPAAAGNAGDIVVSGRRPLAPNEFLGELAYRISDIFLDDRTAKRIGEGFADGLKGYGAAYGTLASGLIFGSGGSPFGAAAGGAIGEKLFEKPFKEGLEKIFKPLGKIAGPLGAIAGGLIGGALGSVFSSTPRGSATIGVGANGQLEVVSTRGNSTSRKQASSSSAGEALDTLDRIAEALGATINASAGSVSIGIRKGNYRVDPTGRGITKTSKGAIDFGQDSAAAIKAATLDLIKDGVLEGLRASTQRILQQATDLDRAIQQAVDFESVFTRLKEYKDPVGAAIDALDKEFKRLEKIFDDAAATTEERAQLEELYDLERKKAIEDARRQVTGSLQDLLDNLTIGDSGGSLRSRIVAAQAKYDPLKARVQAGDITAYDDFADAAQTLIDLKRQLEGSQSGYFSFLDEVKDITKAALDASNAIADAAASRDSPFSGSSVPATDNQAIIDALDAQTKAIVNALLQQGIATQANLAAIIQAIQNGTFGANDNSLINSVGNAGNF